MAKSDRSGGSRVESPRKKKLVNPSLPALLSGGQRELTTQLAACRKWLEKDYALQTVQPLIEKLGLTTEYTLKTLKKIVESPESSNKDRMDALSRIEGIKLALVEGHGPRGRSEALGRGRSKQNKDTREVVLRIQELSSSLPEPEEIIDAEFQSETMAGSSLPGQSSPLLERPDPDAGGGPGDHRDEGSSGEVSPDGGNG